MDISEILKEYLEEHNMSQRELGRRCGISGQTVSNIIKGTGPNGKPITPDTATIEKLAKGTGIPEYRLYGYEDGKAFYEDLMTGIFGEETVRKAKEEDPDFRLIARSAKGVPPVSDELKKKYFAITFGIDPEEKEKPVPKDEPKEENTEEIFMRLAAQMSQQQLLELSKKLIDLASKK